MDNALATRENGITYTANGLILPDKLSFEEWQSVGETLQQMERSVLWWIGDWLLYGEKKYGETYAQVIDTTGMSYQSCANAKWVASRIEFSRRRENLSWAHHSEVAALEPAEQDMWLNLAKQNEWTRNQLRCELQHGRIISQLPDTATDAKVVTDLCELIRRGEKFSTIYADPPWQYGNQSTRAATSNHYLTMTTEQIAALPIKELTAEDCHLHLWTTNAFLFDCPAILEAWGFTYKSMFVWVKPQMGIGNYWRVSHELLLFAIKGSKRFIDRSLMSWGQYERGEHSAKPEQIRQLIERASPAPRLELFGRRVTDGWTVFGNEVQRDLFHPE